MPVPSPWREALRWLARILAIGLFVFWGAFFLAHLQEWFFGDSGDLPPPRVWVGQFFHLLMLIGLAILVWRPAVGAWITLATTAAFFVGIGYTGALFLPLLNAVPSLLVLASQNWGARESTLDPHSTRG